MSACKTCNGRGVVQGGYAGEILEPCPDCPRPDDDTLLIKVEYRNGRNASYFTTTAALDALMVAKEEMERGGWRVTITDNSKG